MSTATDTFNRANSGTLGTADTGQTWVDLVGTHAVNGNRAESGYTTDCFSAVDVGAADQLVTATVYGTITNHGLLGRCTDINNMVVLFTNNGFVQLYDNIAGSYTQLGSDGTGPASGETVALDIQSTTARALVAGVQQVSATTSVASGNRAGLYSGAVLARVYDDFSAVVSGGGGGTPATNQGGWLALLLRR